MIKVTAIITLALTALTSHGQNVGIATINPLAQLHVAGSGAEKLRLDNSTALGANISNEMYFKTGSWFTGGIKTIGASPNTARLGFFTFAATTTSGLNERMSILDNGLVGIGNSAPSLAGLMVDIKSGAVNAMFGSTDLGIAVESNFPGIAYNSYYNGGRKAIGTGYGGLVGMNPVSGDFYIQTSTASYPAGVAMPLSTKLNISNNGKVGIGGSSAGSMLEIIPSFGTADIELNAQVSGGDNAVLRLNKNNTADASLIRFKNAGTTTWDLGTLSDDNFKLIYTPSNITVLQVDNLTRRVGFGTNGYNLELNVAGGIYDYDDLTVLGNTGIGTATPLASLHVKRGTLGGGTAQFEGTTYSSHFNYSTTEDTYLRGGKATSNVFINDLSSGYVGIAAAGGYVSIGAGAPAQKLDIKNGRQRFTGQQGGGAPSGIEFTNYAGTALKGFLGMYDDNNMGFYGFPGAGWSFLYNVNNGNTGFGNFPTTAKLKVDGGGGNALEIAGGIKVSGANKAAFILTADNSNLSGLGFVDPHGVRIDNALSNNNPTAIILVTQVMTGPPTIVIPSSGTLTSDIGAPIYVYYHTDGYWYVVQHSSGVGGYGDGGFTPHEVYTHPVVGSKYNVLIINQ
jgi:hypothetical protein